MVSKLKNYHCEILAALIFLSLGILSGYLVKGGDSLWYLGLKKPSYNPPSWVFGPVWTVLYLMMGVVAAKLWKANDRKLLILFIAQFIVNLAWSPLFFYFNRIDFALMNISLLWVLLTIFLINTKNKNDILILFLPYYLWVSFAWFLNFTIYRIN